MGNNAVTEVYAGTGSTTLITGGLKVTGRSIGISSGIQFTDIAGNTVTFMSMKDDNTLGIYSPSSGWFFNHDITSGNTGMGTNAGTARLTVNGGAQNALEISGGIKVSGNNKPAFQLTVDASNLIYSLSSDLIGFKIDNVFCNNDPNALIFITPVGTINALAVRYNVNIGRWECYTDIPETLNVFYGHKQLTGCGFDGCQDVFYLTNAALNQTYIAMGTKFNIMIIKQ